VKQPPRTLDRYTQGGLEKHNERRGTARRAQAGNLEEYLAFVLGEDAYAVHISHIAEILKPLPITEVPRARRDVVGVMSVRGRLVTVLDLKRRFSIAEPAEKSAESKTRILLVDAAEEHIGFIVDEVLQVYRLAEDEIEPASALGGDQPSHITGVGRPHSGPLLVLLDLRPIMGG
jgi:purine-binding chemotaxis protein CheW